MPLSRFWSAPNSNFTSTSVNGAVTDTAATGAPGWNIGADSIQVPTLVTAPPSSASVFAPGSYSAQTASVATVVQNTLGYDAEFVAYFATTSASVATFQVGVGPSSPVAMTAVATSVTNTAANTVTLSAYTPAGYYFSVQASQANAASVPTQLTIVANPV